MCVYIYVCVCVCVCVCVFVISSYYVQFTFQVRVSSVFFCL